uniref:Peptidase_M13_N domain-containing protein n=1 Tax=Panagrellus redivivus TaxID=6233 RepID=A0A7E4VUR3_PANRE
MLGKGAIGNLCQILLVTTILGILFLKYRSTFNQPSLKPSSSDDVLIPRPLRPGSDDSVIPRTKRPGFDDSLIPQTERPGFDDSLILSTKRPGLTDSLIPRPEPTGFTHSIIPSQPEVCSTQDCVIGAAFYHTNINDKVNPCSNFYDFTCGNFDLSYDIPPGKAMFDVGDVHAKRVQKQLYQSLMANSTKSEEPYETLAKSLFQKCMDENKIDATGIASLLEFLNKFDGGVPFLGGEGFTTSWETFFAKALRFTNVYTPVLVTLAPDPADSTKYIPKFGQAKAFMLDDPSNYAHGTENALVKGARNVLIKVAEMLGASQRSAEKDMTDVLELEMKLAAALLPPALAQRSENTENVVKFGDIKAKYPGIAFQDFVEFFSGYFTFNDNTRVILSEPTYFKQLTAIMTRTPKKVVANMIIMQFIRQSAHSLPKDIFELFYDFGMVQKGFKTKIPYDRLESCIKLNNDLLDLPTSRLYINDHFNHDIVPKLEEMMSYVKKYFIKELKESMWLEDSTRNRAIKKVNAMKHIIGYPKMIFDDNYMRKIHQEYENSRDTESLLSLVQRLIKYKWNTVLRHNGNPTFNYELYLGTVAKQDAYNVLAENTVVYFAGMLQYSYFMADVPKYIQYGIFGSIIGHELQHGFDAIGRYVDENGNIIDWWPKDVVKTFNEKENCYIEQYNAEGVNGKSTVRENMADNVGIKTAFGAYKLWLEEHPDEVEMKMPGFGEYTNEQMFYISWANNWCGLVDEAMDKLVESKHPPGNIRNKVVVRNSAEFDSAFNCPKTTAKTCQLW